MYRPLVIGTREEISLHGWYEWKEVPSHDEPELSFCCCASIRLDDPSYDGTASKWGETHCLAAMTICALRSLKLASRFSGVSSHLAFPPASGKASGSAETGS